MDGEELRSELEGFFAAQVINHGDYSLVYAQPGGPEPTLVLGYRRMPLELVLCPVQVGRPSGISGNGHRIEARLAKPICSIDLSNVSTMADTGTGYQVETVTGFRVGFEVNGTLPIPVGAAAAHSGASAVIVEQGQEAEDFHQFMGHFMDVLDAFYQTPDVHQVGLDAYTPSLAA